MAAPNERITVGKSGLQVNQAWNPRGLDPIISSIYMLPVVADGVLERDVEAWEMRPVP